MVLSLSIRDASGFRSLHPVKSSPLHAARFGATAALLFGAMASLAGGGGPEASGDRLQDWEEVNELLEAVADALLQLGAFASQLLEICKRVEADSFVEACMQLREVCEECGQQDRLIIAGKGNVGKSTIGNALLGGGKFWPTSSSCMTARICEAHYDASASGIAVSKDMVHKSATSQPKEFEEFLEQPLQVPNPSSLLKPGVILVDLPGLNQEKKYIDRLNEYLKSHPSSSVVLVYVLDVNDKICNSDHQFFVKLMSSPWTELSQKLLLVVNKCDIEVARNPLDSEEETPN